MNVTEAPEITQTTKQEQGLQDLVYSLVNALLAENNQNQLLTYTI